METKSVVNAEPFKAFADKNRLMIVDMISCGECVAFCKRGVYDKDKGNTPVVG